MNYQHAYHAGGFSDVVKHATLLALIQVLQQKAKPFVYIDTHAGAGIYDLQTIESQATQEYLVGIAKIKVTATTPQLIKDYLAIIDTINQQHQTTERRFYPGSPLFVRQLLRPSDQMIISELQPKIHQTLRQLFLQDKQVAVHHRDGYEMMKALLPPTIRRGLVLIDPPYEAVDEWQQVITALQHGLERWANGIFVIWYPIKAASPLTAFYQQIAQVPANACLGFEFLVCPADSPIGLNGCGMIIINPPWQFEEALQRLLFWLKQSLAQPGQGQVKLFWL